MSRALIRRLRRSRLGSNAVEFALVLPPTLALVTAIMDYGWYYAQRHCAMAAAAEGARVGALTARDDQPITAASTAAQDKWDGFGLTGTISVAATQTGTPEQMLVVVSLSNAALVGMVPNASSITARSIRQMEEQP